MAARPVLSLSESPPDKAVDQFFATFGKPEHVKQEVLAYWKQQGKFSAPADLYNRLMEERVKRGEISSQRAGILRAVFSDSFTPEYSTGYLAKHRESIVSGLAQLYAENKPPHEMVRIEGDVSNLGGLNVALAKSAVNLQTSDASAFNTLLAENNIKNNDPEAASKLGRVMADRVLHTICQFTLDELKQKSDTIIAVRKGGDEISFVASLKDGVTKEDMQDAIRKTQASVAQLVKSAGLVIPHLKYPKDKWKSGVGIGLHMVDMQLHTPEEQAQQLAGGVSKSKDIFQRILHRAQEPNITVPDMKNITTLLKELHNYSETNPVHTVVPNVDGVGSNKPDLQRLTNLKTLMQEAGSTKLTRAENAAILGTHKLVRKADFVTGLPLFENMQAEQRPYFMNRFGNKQGGAKLVNVDFSNVAGGNELSEGLGNHMIRAYSDVLTTAMISSGLNDSLDSISVRPGGKFTLLVPANISEDTMATFALNLHQQLKEASKATLALSQEAQDDIREKIKIKPELEEKYGPGCQQLKNAEGKWDIRIGQILNPKSKLPGANVVMTYSDKAIDPNHSLGDQLKPLEAQAEKRQAQLNSYRVTSGMGFADLAKYHAAAMEAENNKGR